MATSWAAPAVGTLVVGIVMACAAEPPPIDEVELVAAALPLEVTSWQAAGDDEIYDTGTIFSYIDGQAEVYLAYGMERCLARRYSGSEGEPYIVLDLFELASAEDAYGVFTHDRDGDDIDIGQGALLRTGWLSFWKGRWFGSVYAEGESEPAYEAVIAIARGAADAIAGRGTFVALEGGGGLDEGYRGPIQPALRGRGRATGEVSPRRSLMMLRNRGVPGLTWALQNWIQCGRQCVHLACTSPLSPRNPVRYAG